MSSAHKEDLGAPGCGRSGFSLTRQSPGPGSAGRVLEAQPPHSGEALGVCRVRPEQGKLPGGGTAMWGRVGQDRVLG